MMPNISSFNVAYDADADVLYITKVAGPAARGIEDSHGIVWRYDSGGALMSATVVDFHEFWAGRSKDLADELSRQFHIPANQAQVVVDRALELGDG